MKLTDRFNIFIKTILLVCLFGIFQTAHADSCDKAVVLLKKGEPAPCEGFLFSPDAEKKASQAVDDAKYYKDLSELLHSRNDLLQKQLAINDERLMLYMKTTEELAQEVVRKQHEDFWQKAAYFGLGIAVTGLSIYAAAQAIK
jgi:hypothetical protein